MAGNLTTLVIQGNQNTDASPTWVTLSAAGGEIRWAADNAAYETTGASAWPLYDRDASATPVPMVYFFTADATGSKFDSYSTASPPASGRLMLRVHTDSGETGTWGSAPIITAYPDTSHGAVTTGNGSILGGSADTLTGGTYTSYLKGAAYGVDNTAQTNAPSTLPGSVTATSWAGSASVAPANATSWTAWQSLQGDNHYITCNITPNANGGSVGGALDWHFMIRLYNGPNMTTGTLTPVVSAKYTYT